jgi:hypothetical protein
MPRANVLPSALHLYAEGHLYADGHRASAEGGLRRGDTPTAALVVPYADGKLLDAEGWRPSAYCCIPVVIVFNQNISACAPLPLPDVGHH